MPQFYVVSKVLILKILLASLAGLVISYEYGYHPSAEEFDQLKRETRRTWTGDLLANERRRAWTSGSNRRMGSRSDDTSTVYNFVPKYNYEKERNRYAAPTQHHWPTHFMPSNEKIPQVYATSSQQHDFKLPQPENVRPHDRNDQHSVATNIGTSLDFTMFSDEVELAAPMVPTFGQPQNLKNQKKPQNMLTDITHDETFPSTVVKSSSTTTTSSPLVLLNEPITSGDNEHTLYKNHTNAQLPIFFTNPATGIIYAITEVGKVPDNSTSLANDSIPIYITKQQYDRDLFLQRKYYEDACRKTDTKQTSTLPINTSSVISAPSNTTLKPQIIRLQKPPKSVSKLPTAKVPVRVPRPPPVMVQTGLTVSDQIQLPTHVNNKTTKRKKKKKKKRTHKRPGLKSTPTTSTQSILVTNSINNKAPQIILGKRPVEKPTTGSVHKIATQLEKPGSLPLTIFSNRPVTTDIIRDHLNAAKAVHLKNAKNPYPNHKIHRRSLTNVRDLNDRNIVWSKRIKTQNSWYPIFVPNSRGFLRKLPRRSRDMVELSSTEGTTSKVLTSTVEAIEISTETSSSGNNVTANSTVLDESSTATAKALSTTTNASIALTEATTKDLEDTSSTAAATSRSSKTSTSSTTEAFSSSKASTDTTKALEDTSTTSTTSRSSKISSSNKRPHKITKKKRKKLKRKSDLVDSEYDEYDFGLLDDEDEDDEYEDDEDDGEDEDTTTYYEHVKTTKKPQKIRRTSTKRPKRHKTKKTTKKPTTTSTTTVITQVVEDDDYDAISEDDLKEEISHENSSSAEEGADYGAMDFVPEQTNYADVEQLEIQKYNTKNTPTKKKRIRRRPSKHRVPEYVDDEEDEDSGIGGFFRMLFYPVHMVMSKLFDTYDDRDSSGEKTQSMPTYTLYHKVAYNDESIEADDEPENSFSSWLSSWFGYNRRTKKIGSTTARPPVAPQPTEQSGWFDTWFSYGTGKTTTEASAYEDYDDDKWFFGLFDSRPKRKRRRSTTTTTTTQPQVPQVPILTIVDPMRNPQNWIGILAHHIINTTATSTHNPLLEAITRATTTTTTENPDIPRKISYDKYQIWRLKPQEDAQVKALEEYKESEEGVMLQWLKGPSLRGLNDILVPPKMLIDFQATLNFESIDHEVLIFDVGKAIAYEKTKEHFYGGATPKPPKHSTAQRGTFSMSWQKYNEYDDIVKYLESLRLRHPQIIELIHIGRSYEGRPLLIVKIESRQTMAATAAAAISGHKKLKFKKKSGQANGVFIEAGTHGTEWIGPATATWMISELLRIMKSNKTSSDLEFIKKTTWYILPVLNPDGYVYTHEYDRFWKKSRSRHISRPGGLITSAMTWLQQRKAPERVCYGVDLDRNWNYQWGGRGSSRSPCNEFYAGPVPFSEPETKALSEFLMDYRKQIKLYISLQSYGQIISFPNKANGSYNTERMDDFLDVAMVGTDGLRKKGSKSRYKIDASSDLIENRSGCSDAFAAYEVGIPFSYTLQLADNGVHGYLLPSSSIESTARDAFEIMTTMLDYI